jgi:hypothetical protein
MCSVSLLRCFDRVDMAVGTAVYEFAQESFGSGFRIEMLPLHGGLEAEAISRVVVRRRGKPIGSFVAKPFCGAAARELDVYRFLRTTAQTGLAPKLLGWRYTSRSKNVGYVFLEWVEPDRCWPWQDLAASSLVLQQLATLHRSRPVLSSTILATYWDYESELIQSSHLTLEAYRRGFMAGLRPGGRPMLPALERLLSTLPRLRRELIAFTGTTLVHGDAHPGNAVIRKRTAVLLDWARARIGSPLEDVSSWVHSLASWEPEARRRHDTLLRHYRAVCSDSPSTLSADFREACVLAGACNALAGALRYHLAVLQDRERSDREQFDSYQAAADWLRIIRRADLCFAPRA